MCIWSGRSINEYRYFSHEPIARSFEDKLQTEILIRTVIVNDSVLVSSQFN